VASASSSATKPPAAPTCRRRRDAALDEEDVERTVADGQHDEVGRDREEKGSTRPDYLKSSLDDNYLGVIVKVTLKRKRTSWPPSPAACSSAT
jgi:hypothetical protein